MLQLIGTMSVTSSDKILYLLPRSPGAFAIEARTSESAWKYESLRTRGLSKTSVVTSEPRCRGRQALGAVAFIASADVGLRESCHCAGSSPTMRALRGIRALPARVCMRECTCRQQLLRAARFLLQKYGPCSQSRARRVYPRSQLSRPVLFIPLKQ